MDPITTYFLALGGVLALAVVLFVYLRRPLRAVLTELCGGEQRGDLWMRLLGSAMPLTVLLFGVVAPSRHDGWFETARGVLRSGVFGLLAFLGVTALFLLAFIARYDHRQALERREARRTPAG